RLDAAVSARAGRRPHRLAQAVEADDRRTAEIVSVAFKKAEQPVVSAIAMNPYLVEPGHPLTHGLPLPAARERRRRRRGHCLQHRLHLSSYLIQQSIEEVDGGHRASRVIIL